VGVALLATGGILLLALLSKGGGEARTPGYHSPTLFAMDTTLNLTIQGRTEEEARRDTDAVVAYLEDLEARTSRFRPGSEVSAINGKAGVEPVAVSADVLEMVERSVELSRATGGAFDVTVAPVVELWGFYDQEYRVPGDAEIEEAVKLVDYTKIIIDRETSTVMLADRGMEIDLGGVAKGHAVAGTCDILRERGVEHGLVNFGGAVGAVGRRLDGRPWVVGIKNPRGGPGDLVAELEVADSYVGTSGDYERYFVMDGKRYCHIFDPRTGRQGSGAMGVTVVGPDSTVCDILATAVFVLGPEEGLVLVDEMEEFEALVVDDRGRIETSSGMDSRAIRVEERI